MALHESLGKGLAALKPGTLLVRPDKTDVRQGVILVEIISEPLNQRCFRACNDHVHGMGKDKLSDSLEIHRVKGDILSAKCSACIARCNKQFVAKAALRDLPGHGMFTTAASNKQNVHRKKHVKMNPRTKTVKIT